MPTARGDDAVAGLADAVDELYALAPEDFTGRRDDLARTARSAGDKALATAVRRLRRPTTSAWALNLLSREEAGLVGELTALGESLRDAQAGLDGAALRELDKQRRGVVGALARRAGELAEEHGHPLDAALSRQVEQSLSAAMTDPDAGAAVTSGQLTRPVSVVGFGVEVDPDAVAVPTLVLVGTSRERSTSGRRSRPPQRQDLAAASRPSDPAGGKVPRRTAGTDEEVESLARARARRDRDRLQREKEKQEQKEREERRAEASAALETARTAEAEAELSAQQVAAQAAHLRVLLEELTAERDELVARLAACDEQTAGATAQLTDVEQRQEAADGALAAARQATRRAGRQAAEAGATGFVPGR